MRRCAAWPEPDYDEFFDRDRIALDLFKLERAYRLLLKAYVNGTAAAWLRHLEQGSAYNVAYIKWENKAKVERIYRKNTRTNQKVWESDT